MDLSPPWFSRIASVKFIVNTATEPGGEESIALADLSLEPPCFALPCHSVIHLKKRDSLWIRGRGREQEKERTKREVAPKNFHGAASS